MVYDSDLVGEISKYFASAAVFCYGIIATFTALGSDIGMYMPVLLGIGALCLSATICLVSSLVYDYCKDIVSIKYHRCLSSFCIYCNRCNTYFYYKLFYINQY